jgi:site-specific DNA recombinase
MGKLMLNILLSFAQFERENTSEKTRDKMKQRARLGKWHGGWFPFGYDYNKETKKLVINKKETQAVRKIFEQFIEGRKPSEIANLLNSKGIRTKTRTIKTKDDQTKNIGENRLNEDFIKKILSNPLYKGFVEFANEEFKGEHEAIISTTTWDKANKMLKPVIPRRIEYAKDSHIHLLKGLAKCGECDVSLTPYPGGKKDKNGNPYLYYACGKVVDIGKESPCKVRLLPAREFEKAVKDALIELGKNKPLIDSAIKNNSKLTKTRIKPLQAEMNKTEQALIDRTAQINRLVKVLKSKDMVSKEVSEEYKRMLSERSLLETQKEKLVLDIERCKQDMLDAELIRKTLLSFDKVVGSLPIEDQKDLFQLLIKQITVWSFDPTKEKAPKEIGAFVTKIRTRWFRIKLELYQFPEIETYYRSIREKKASSDFHKNWLPREDSNLGQRGYDLTPIARRVGLYLCHSRCRP